MRRQILDNKETQHHNDNRVVQYRPQHPGWKDEKNDGQEQEQGQGGDQQRIVASDTDGADLIEQKKKNGQKDQEGDEVEECEPDGGQCLEGNTDRFVLLCHLTQVHAES